MIRYKGYYYEMRHGCGYSNYRLYNGNGEFLYESQVDIQSQDREDAENEVKRIIDLKAMWN